MELVSDPAGDLGSEEEDFLTFVLVEEAAEPAEDSLDFLRRFFLGISGAGDSLPCGSDEDESLVLHDLLDCLDFSDFSLIGESLTLTLTLLLPEDCRFDDFGSRSGKSLSEFIFILLLLLLLMLLPLILRGAAEDAHDGADLNSFI